MTEPYDFNTGVHTNVQITIDLNELVWARGEHLKQEMSVNQAEYIAETLRRSLTWDTMYGMIDEVLGYCKLLFMLIKIIIGLTLRCYVMSF